MALSQMNVRIDDELKARGDSVFSSLGLSTTDVVRAVWSYAAEHGEAPCIVQQALDSPSSIADELDGDYRMLIANDTHNLLSRLRESLGIPTPDLLDEIDYRAMREEAWATRLESRELA